MNIYVANLNYSIQNERLSEIFSAFGTVVSAKVIMDRETNRSKGFGFVEMGSEADGNAAIEALNGATVEGKILSVRVALPKKEGEDRKPYAGNSDYKPRTNVSSDDYRKTAVKEDDTASPSAKTFTNSPSKFKKDEKRFKKEEEYPKKPKKTLLDTGKSKYKKFDIEDDYDL